MDKVHRRNALLVMAGGIVAASSGMSCAQEQALPEVRRSEAKAIIKEYVDKLSEAKRRYSGVEMSVAQKNKMEHEILSDIEQANIYTFWDP